MADQELKVAGDDSFALGMDSFTLPSKLLPGEYAVAMNTISRGGLIQTRPGSQPITSPLGGGPLVNVQGLTMFQPTGQTNPALVFAIDGLVYYTYPPFNSVVQLPLQFDPDSKFVAWASCLQWTYYDADGILKNLDQPKAVLVMQDGNTRAAFWDGATARHLNPTPSGSDVTIDGFDETPMGLWMCWSNNRLWVSRGSQIFASDIGNPLKFTETQYLNEARAFYLKSDCTGIAETPDRLGIICFTSDSGDLIKSSIQDREMWLSTPAFQQVILPSLGCVAPRSIVQQYGMLWWYSARGLINLDDALKTYISSQLNTRDNEMFQSKYTMNPDVSTVAGGWIENFLLHAVPVASKLNTRIHVMDQAPLSDEGPIGAWASYWTGWRPVELARGVINGSDFIFMISKDYDENVRIWQLFRQDKTDGGMPITSFVVTKQEFFGDRDYKRFKYAEVELQNISGPTALAIGVSGFKGGFQKVGEKDLNSVNGQVYWDQLYGYQANDFAGSRPQTRIVRTIDMPPASECNSECIESDNRGLIDKAFSLMIIWSGIAGVSAYRMFSQFEPQDQGNQGICEDDETGENRLVTPSGCGIEGLFSIQTPFETFYSHVTYNYTATLTQFDPPIILPLSLQAYASSIISQVDSDRKALARAKFLANQASGS